MQRRDFITLLGGAAAAWPLAARARQQTAVPVIGWLSARTADTDALVLPAFREGLNAHGYVEGRNLLIEYRWADGRYDRVPALAAELVRRQVAVLFTAATANLDPEAARSLAASTPLPMVFLGTGNDPVDTGILPPGGNATGVDTLMRAAAPKRLGFLHELLPRISTIGVLINPASASAGPELAAVQDAARTLSLQTEVLRASTERDIDLAFETLARQRVSALLVNVDPFFFSRAQQLVVLAAQRALPTMYFRSDFVKAGGLLSYGSDTRESYRIGGDYVGRILKGAKPSELPVQRPTRFELAINLKTAKAIR
jgi:putative ABC transport system substrate-binding protein